MNYSHVSSGVIPVTAMFCLSVWLSQQSTAIEIKVNNDFHHCQMCFFFFLILCLRVRPISPCKCVTDPSSSKPRGDEWIHIFAPDSHTEMPVDRSDENKMWLAAKGCIINPLNGHTRTLHFHSVGSVLVWLTNRLMQSSSFSKTTASDIPNPSLWHGLSSLIIPQTASHQQCVCHRLGPLIDPYQQTDTIFYSFFWVTFLHLL